MAKSNWGEERSPTARRGRWSQAEIARFKELYGLRDDAAIARELSRSVASVRRMAETLFKQPPKTGPWSDSEIRDLKKYLGASSIDVVARILHRSEGDVQAQVAELAKVQQSGRWTPQEVNDLKRLYGTRTDEDLAIVFGRSVESVRRVAQKHCLAKDKAFLRRLAGGEPSSRMPRWRKDELDLLREKYPRCSNLEIAQELGRSVKSVVSKAHNLGLKKDPQRLREMGRENVSLRYNKPDEA